MISVQDITKENFGSQNGGGQETQFPTDEHSDWHKRKQMEARKG